MCAKIFKKSGKKNYKNFVNKSFQDVEINFGKLCEEIQV